ncbi:MAG: oligosaccharide flippase family protein [Clostridia bacterium]|nr:oligosaccharide flippase family protein [Clostridia bacterium]
MRSSHVLLKGAAVMTVFSLLGKLLGVLLRLYLTSRIGSEGIGLYQLIMSVYGLFATFSTAGLTVAVSRLVAEKAERNLSDATVLLRASVLAGLCISAAATVALLVSSDFFAVSVVKDASCAPSLRILALSMPFMAIAACFQGWFIARRQVLRCSSASLFEQCVKFAVMALFLNVLMANVSDIASLCTGIVLGVTVGEGCSFVYLWAAYRFLAGRQKRKEIRPSQTFGDSMRNLVGVMAPIGLSVMVTSLLHTAENLLIPSVFERYGGDRAKALSEFGVIRGMVIPLLFFPFAFLQSLVSVMIPEISRLNVASGTASRDRQIGRILSVSFLFGIAAGGLFFFLPEELGETFYPGEGTADALRLLALVNPLMYVQTICDGLLKAVDGQKYTLRYSVYNSVLRIAVILTLIPLSGATGYLLLLVLSNTVEFALCYRRLKKYARFSVGCVKGVLAPVGCALVGGIASRAVVSLPFLNTFLSKAMAGTSVYLVLFLLLARPLYMGLLGKKQAEA